MARVLTGNDALVPSPIFTDATGEAADCASTPTCAVTRDDGTVLTAATVANVAGQLGAYTAALTATTHNTRLDWLTLTWTGTVTGLGTVVLTQTVEVVERFYLTVPDMRRLNGLSDPTKFPAAVLREACNDFEDKAERYCGTAFVRRYQRDNLRGNGTSSVFLTRAYPVTLLSAALIDTAGTSTAYTTTGWSFDRTRMLNTGGTIFPVASYNNLIVRYTHGLPAPESDLLEAARTYVTWKALRDRSQVGRDILSTIDASGLNVRYSTPDWEAGRPTGIGDVDATLNSIGQDRAFAY